MTIHRMGRMVGFIDLRQSFHYPPLYASTPLITIIANTVKRRPALAPYENATKKSLFLHEIGTQGRKLIQIATTRLIGIVIIPRRNTRKRKQLHPSSSFLSSFESTFIEAPLLTYLALALRERRSLPSNRARDLRPSCPVGSLKASLELLLRST